MLGHGYLRRSCSGGGRECADRQAQRTYHQRSGEGYAPSFYEAYGYNDRGELTSAEYHAAVYPATNHVSANDHGFAYDPIGNRRQATQPLAGFSPEYYCTNALNQILTIDDADTCPPGSPNKSLSYDADGNMTSDGDLVLVYDAENRLVEVAPASPASGDKKAVFVYDYRNRRVQKTVYEHNGSAWGGSPVARTRYVWDGWLLIAELDGLDSNAPVRTFWWGLDLAGQRGGRPGDAAGGIGGLLAVWDRTATEDYDEMGGGLEDGRKWVFAYDALGNVGQLVDLFPDRWQPVNILAARYEYDPYGNVTAAGGDYADRNRFRFSTKQFEAESGLGYWGERFYHPAYGRWVNRDPIEEAGGDNLYLMAMNRPTFAVDLTGLLAIPCFDLPTGESQLPPLRPNAKHPPPSPSSKPTPSSPTSGNTSGAGGTGGCAVQWTAYEVGGTGKYHSGIRIIDAYGSQNDINFGPVATLLPCCADNKQHSAYDPSPVRNPSFFDGVSVGASCCDCLRSTPPQCNAQLPCNYMLLGTPPYSNSNAAAHAAYQRCRAVCDGWRIPTGPPIKGTAPAINDHNYPGWDNGGVNGCGWSPYVQ